MDANLHLLNNQSEMLEGIVDRIVFHNSENGYTVLKIQPEKKNAYGRQPEEQTAVGCLAEPRAGSRMRFRGKYVKHPRFGTQFAFDMADEVMPATTEGIRLYLASGLIKGIGQDIAGRIVAKFGMDTIRIMDEEPDELLKVRGIGQKTYNTIRESWSKHRGVRELMMFLQPHGISPAYGVRIFRAYGEEAMRVVRENPYRLAMDIRGIGFITADAIATKLGFPADHPLRLQAATLYILQKASEEGHVYLPQNLLVQKVNEQTGATEKQILTAIMDLSGAQRLTCEEFDQNNKEVETGVYLKRFHHCESKIAYYLQRLLNSPKSVRFEDAPGLVERVLKSLPITLDPAQSKAVLASTQQKVMILTGGPGTGKTTIINAIIKVFTGAGANVLLAAPTGRAAKRMTETSGREAKTIHRLLEYSPLEEQFAKNEDNPLSCGLLIIDEASMIDTTLFYHLLKAAPIGATLLLVGDSHQLPSVGPGNVLGDIIASGSVHTVELNKIFRQSEESMIICNAHLINRGQMPVLERNAERHSDFYFIARDDPEEAANLIVDLIKNRIPNHFGLNAVNDVQFLTPMHKGAVGSGNMNARLQAALNPNGLEIKRGDKVYRLHDKVMQVRNNYDKDIFNGDIGQIIYIDPKERTLSVNFDGVNIPYEYDELDELVPAYAISIHKSQGSEYPAVVIPLMMQHYILLQRNLIYTGVTRGKKLVILVGEQKALQIAIRNNKTSKRYTHLAERIASNG